LGLLLGIFLAVSAGTAEAAGGEVRMWEEALTIPTYEAAAADVNPIFYEGRTYQGAKGPVYPYPITDRLLNIRKERVYKGLFLENDYLKICVLPELGGRIFSAVDKTNGYNFFYRQHVIKPALIGMLGAWISGGVEWNIPHHHRATSYSPVSHTLEENADGSKTIWVGEMELRHRMRWVVGLTLHPDSSCLEGTVRLFNETPVTHSFLYFANVAVHANPDYQIIFPPSTQFATQHSKSEFSRWPNGEGYYAGVDYRGVDCSWWKNHPKPVSMFAFDCEEEFLAGYDHGREAGTLHVSDRFVMPGKKFFTWGTGTQGQTWDRTLTDTDGPYLELMVGGFSDNQPDYSWIQPYEYKTVKHTWYPFQRIGGVKNATREAAVNLEVTPEDAAKVGLCTTAAYREARVLVEAGSKTLFEETIEISPGNPFLTEIALPENVKEEDLRVSLAAEGRELVAYRPVRRERLPMPPRVQAPPQPEDAKTNEELYLSGLRLEQFYSPAREAAPYYEEAVKRDPSDYRANTALGLVYLNRGLFKEAEEKFRAAADRATKNYTRPRDGEAYYSLGLALKAQGKYNEAYEAFYKATWSLAWHSAGFHALAELACRQGDFIQSLDFLDRSLATNAYNVKALNLKAAVLRQVKRFSEAEKAAAAALALDPLDFRAKRERSLAMSMNTKTASSAEIIVNENLHDDVQPCLEAAVDYANAGLWDEGVHVLKDLVGAYRDTSRVFPMAYYYLGSMSQERGEKAEASRYYQLASEMPADYCFPFRLESIAVLRRAIAENPNDARAPYYLGNLLYDLQPEEAIKEWERARRLDPAFALVNRNLGLGYSRVAGDNAKAIASLETAISQKVDARFLYELDRLYEAENVPAEKRLAFLRKHHETALERDDVLSREIELEIHAGDYDKALALLSGRQFNVWEGGGRFSVHDSYVDAHLLRGHRYREEGKYPKAMEDYEAAFAYPENLSVGKPYQGDRSPQIHYFMGLTYEASGKEEQAKEAFRASVAEIGEDGRSGRSMRGYGADVLYCQARAFQKLGEELKAARVFERLRDFGEGELGRESSVDYFAKFGEKTSSRLRTAQGHYALGLGHLGGGNRDAAKAEFEKALELNVAHLGANVELSELSK
jgi:tetratricopeptide (TPR) repeat protein